jgi:hypothetical protein
MKVATAHLCLDDGDPVRRSEITNRIKHATGDRIMSTATGNSTHAVLPWSASPNVPTKESWANKTRGINIDAKHVCLIRMTSVFCIDTCGLIFSYHAFLWLGTALAERGTRGARYGRADEFTTGLRDAYTDSRGKGGEYAGMAFAQQVFLVAGGVLRVDKLPSLCGWDLAALV